MVDNILAVDVAFVAIVPLLTDSEKLLVCPSGVGFSGILKFYFVDVFRLL